MRGVCYVAYGQSAIREAGLSLSTLRGHNALPASVIGDAPISGAAWLNPSNPGKPMPLAPGDAEGTRFAESPMRQSRWAKLNLDSWSPYDPTLYVDADTRVRGDLSFLFEAVEDGWDMVIAPSQRQGGDMLGHLGAEEREATQAVMPLALQAGVFCFRKSPEVLALFESWRQEWGKRKREDMGALLRALALNPVTIWLVSNDFNGGSVVEHRFGTVRR
ncbi:MAG TPA: hypothetical protein VJA25_04855 [Dehalococcoidia bacterium]|nr:hypothetical protein [Dehalococcoidia bacterium]